MVFFEWVLIASGISSIMAIMIFLIKSLFKDKLGVKWNYYIWFLLMIRLIIPPNFIESPLSIYNAIPTEIHNKISLTDKYASNDFSYHRTYDEVESSQKRDFNEIENIERDISSTAAPTESKTKTISNPLTLPNPLTLIINNKDSMFKIAYILWVIGVFTLTFCTIYANIKLNIKFNKNRISNDKKLDDILNSCKEKMNINKRLTLIVSNEVKSAAIFGLFNPKLLLPGQVINRLSDNEVQHIILHELSHLKRKDIVIKWIMTAMQIIHWFNPIIWYSFYRMDQDCEVVCDATALSYIETKDHKEYGFTIIRLVELFSQPNWIPGTMSVAGNKSNIKRRIKMINLFSKKSWKWSIIGTVLFITIAVGLTISIQPAQTIEGSRQVVKATDNKTITFPDANLEKAIRDKIDKPTGDITKEDVEKITELDLKNLEISNLEGIRYLTNLTDLIFWNSKIKDLSPLSNLENLQYLHLMGDNIEDISPLKNLTNLAILKLSIAELEDISPLENLTKLYDLHLLGNNIEDISALENLTNLKRLGLVANGIEDLSFLENLTNLKLLSLVANELEDISILDFDKYYNLNHLSLTHSQIKDISPLKSLINLTNLNLVSNKIEDITPLSNLENLDVLYLDDNPITDYSPIAKLNLDKCDIPIEKLKL